MNRSLLCGVCIAGVLALPGPATASGLVALGDSFSSGQGATSFDPATTGHGNTCWRSPQAWPNVLAAALAVTALPSLACDGARTPEVVTSDRRRHEVERRTSQVARIAGDPAIITITIGGNDIGFADVLGHCVGDRNCVKRYHKSTGDLIEADIATLERELPDVYRAIARAAPGARVVVVDYPQLFPSAVPGREVGNCAAYSAISRREVRYLNARGASLNRAIRRAAGRAGVTVVDVEDAFAGHELSCSGKDPYVNKLRLRAGWPLYRKTSFHPTVGGHARLAAVVAARLRQ
jgi:lysophospholipase L1-like esterase